MLAPMCHNFLDFWMTELPKVFQYYGAAGYEGGVWPAEMAGVNELVQWMAADESKIAAQLVQIFHAVSNTRPHTLTHGDFNPGNIWTNEKGEVLVADWQLMGKGTASFDFGTLLCCQDATSADKNGLDLMTEYHRQLAQANPEAAAEYPLQMMLDDCEPLASALPTESCLPPSAPTVCEQCC